MNMRTWVTLLLLSLVTLASACRNRTAEPVPDPLVRAYDMESDWNDPQRTIALNYEQSQGKRVFYTQCVWCHADTTPAGPSNRSNVNPNPPLMNDGAALNKESDEYMRNLITLGGSALGKSAMMPPYGRMLSDEDIRDVIAFTRAIAVPAYQSPVRPGAQYSVK
jgi:mono/diheme cytochrome c family protein